MGSAEAIGVEAGSFPAFRTILHTWKRAVVDRGWYDANDAPWWYNERAVLSLFVGAIWRNSLGWAMEEYSTSKRYGRNKYHGRGDVLFTLGRQYYAAEAKQCFPSLWSVDQAISKVRQQLREAGKDVRRGYRERGTEMLGIVFVAPCFPRRLNSKEERERWRTRRDAFISQLRAESRSQALAWAFPEWGERLAPVREDGRHYSYPGGVLIIGREPNLPV